LRFTSRDLCNGELHAAAHRINSFGSHVYAVSKMPRTFLRRGAAPTPRTRRPPPPFPSRKSDNGVIPFAENTPRARRIFKSVDRQ
jgi:hypothetical protein